MLKNILKNTRILSESDKVTLLSYVKQYRKGGTIDTESPYLLAINKMKSEIEELALDVYDQVGVQLFKEGGKIKYKDPDYFDLELPTDESIRVDVAKTDDERRLGLSNRSDIDSGMLFVFPYIGKHTMWMKDTYEPLDMIFMGEDGNVLGVDSGEPGNANLIGEYDKVKYVLELPKGFVDSMELEEGDVLTIPDEYNTAEDENKESVASLLDETGKEQMDINGGERVFSIGKTAEIVDLAKKAETEKDILALGKLIAEEINEQNQRDPDYVNETKYQYAERGGVIDPIDDYLIALPDAAVSYGHLRRVLRMQGFELNKSKTDPTSLF